MATIQFRCRQSTDVCAISISQKDYDHMAICLYKMNGQSEYIEAPIVPLFRVDCHNNVSSIDTSTYAIVYGDIRKCVTSMRLEIDGHVMRAVNSDVRTVENLKICHGPDLLRSNFAPSELKSRNISNNKYLVLHVNGMLDSLAVYNLGFIGYEVVVHGAVGDIKAAQNVMVQGNVRLCRAENGVTIGERLSIKKKPYMTKRRIAEMNANNQIGIQH